MSRATMLKEMFSAVEAGQKNRDDRDFPWTPMTRRAFLTPSIYSPSPQERIFKQPEGVRRFSKPLPARGFNEFVANGSNIPNAHRVHTPHIYDRKNFMAPSVLPRSAGLMGADYDASPQDVDESGLVKLLTKPIDINVPDSRDLEWIAERARLDAEGKHSVLPFGRQQLTFKKNVTLVDEFAQGISHAHSLKERVKIISGSVASGLAKTKQGIAQLGQQVAKVLIQNSLTNTLSAAELAESYKQIEKLNISEAWNIKGLDNRRIWSNAQFKNKKTVIVLFLLSKEQKRLKKSSQDLPVSHPIPKFSYDRKTRVLTREAKGRDISFLNTHLLQNNKDAKPTKIGSSKTFASTTSPQFFIDLKMGGIVPFDYAVNEALGGANNRKLNDFVVPHVTALDEKDPYIMPIGIYNPIWANRAGYTTGAQQKLGININPAAVINMELIPVPEFNVKTISPKKSAKKAAKKAAKAAKAAAKAAKASASAAPVTPPTGAADKRRQQLKNRKIEDEAFKLKMASLSVDEKMAALANRSSTVIKKRDREDQIFSFINPGPKPPPKPKVTLSADAKKRIKIKELSDRFLKINDNIGFNDDDIKELNKELKGKLSQSKRVAKMAKLNKLKREQPRLKNQKKSAKIMLDNAEKRPASSF